MDWDKLRIFHAVAEAGSLTHAGEELRLSQSAVSRQIRSLEESLGATLFHRHARGLMLTEQGELLAHATGKISGMLDATAARIRDADDHVTGELRVTTTTGFGTLWLTRRLRRLLDSYPELKIDLKLDERVLDLPMRDADVAIRMKEPSQADLIRRRLMDVRVQLFASEGYLETVGMPQSLSDLSTHRILCQSAESPQPAEASDWTGALLRSYSPPHLAINSYFGVLQATRHGLGIGVLPDYLALEAPDLVRVLPGEQSGEVPVFLAYPEELRHSKRVAVFREFVLEEIASYRQALRATRPV